MNMPDTTDVAQIDELLRRSSLHIEQQRIHVAELTNYQALRAEGVLTEMLASIDRLTKYRAKLNTFTLGDNGNALLQSNFNRQS